MQPTEQTESRMTASGEVEAGGEGSEHKRKGTHGQGQQCGGCWGEGV